MIFPCQTVVREALPAIKSALAQALVKEGMTQVEVSKLLGTTEATISHYMKGKRGSAMRNRLGTAENGKRESIVVLGKQVQIKIDEIAQKISEGSLSEEQLSQELCGICQKVQKTCAICGAKTTEDCEFCKYT